MSRSAWQRKPPDAYWNISPERLAWVAGLVEGEGTIRTHKTRHSPTANRTYAYPMVGIQMTDEDVLRRVQEWTGLGNVIGPYSIPSRPRAKPFWMWKVQRKDQAITLITALWPLLCGRRKEQARTVLKAFKEGCIHVQDSLAKETS